MSKFGVIAIRECQPVPASGNLLEHTSIRSYVSCYVICFLSNGELYRILQRTGQMLIVAVIA